MWKMSVSFQRRLRRCHVTEAVSVWSVLVASYFPLVCVYVVNVRWFDGLGEKGSQGCQVFAR